MIDIALKDKRQANPKTIYDTRAVQCPDGVTRLVTLSHWSWLALETVIEKKYLSHSLQKVIDHCFAFAETLEHPDMTVKLENELTYFAQSIFEKYTKYCDDFGVDHVDQMPIRSPDQACPITVYKDKN